MLAERISLFVVRFHRGRSPLAERWALLTEGWHACTWGLSPRVSSSCRGRIRFSGTDGNTLILATIPDELCRSPVARRSPINALQGSLSTLLVYGVDARNTD